ncbi:MAG: hypothetical protein M4D80_18555 [Myxococcota bacterium]|nr:hypothetical protein [Myxococcota bacterium]
MRQHLVTLLWASALSGCSLIYNPSNIDKNQMPPDAAIADANPALIKLKEVKSPPLLEGAGQGGSAPAILVVFGEHITPSAVVTIVPRTNPMSQVAIEVSNVSIAADGNSIGALVKAAYMEGVDQTGPNASGVLKLDVIVTQDGASPQMIEWDYKPLDELAPGVQPAPAAGTMFSHVDVTNVDFTGTNKAIVQAVGDIKISGRVTANANGNTAGAGGCNGGAAGQPGQCFGGGKAAGGGGGFGAPGIAGNANTAGAVSGDPLITIYDGAGMAMNRGGGGAGGDGVEGGGGGGVIELTAGGAITVENIQAKGGTNGTASVTRGAGGGAGGTVVLRAGGQLSHPAMLDIGGGAGGAGGALNISPGGAGGVGRWRFDAAAVARTAPAPAPRRGPMIVRPPNPIFEDKNATLMITGENGVEITIITRYADNTSTTDTTTLIGDPSSYEAVLRIGINTVCVLVPGGSFADDEAKNCVDVAFIP